MRLMNKLRFVSLIIIILSGISLLHALPSKEKESASVKSTEEEKTIVIVTGLVRLVGASAFSELVITSEEAQWYIAKEDREKLHQLQQRMVTVEGEETVRELKFAGGQSAGLRRELRNIKIISIQQ